MSHSLTSSSRTWSAEDNALLFNNTIEGTTAAAAADMSGSGGLGKSSHDPHHHHIHNPPKLDLDFEVLEFVFPGSPVTYSSSINNNNQCTYNSEKNNSSIAIGGNKINCHPSSELGELTQDQLDFVDGCFDHGDVFDDNFGFLSGDSHSLLFNSVEIAGANVITPIDSNPYKDNNISNNSNSSDSNNSSISSNSNSNSNSKSNSNSNSNNNSSNNNTLQLSTSAVGNISSSSSETGGLLQESGNGSAEKPSSKGGRYKQRGQYKCGICGMDKVKGSHTCQQVQPNKRSRVDIVQELILSDIIATPKPYCKVSDSILRSILNLTPFDLVEYWVPFFLTSSISKLILHGLHSNEEQLKSNWFEKSKIYEFEPNEGLVGRVAFTQKAEIIDDVALVTEAVFLRKDIAIEYDIHTTVALAQQLGAGESDKLAGVFIFYSRSKFQLTEHFILFLRDIVEHIIVH